MLFFADTRTARRGTTSRGRRHRAAAATRGDAMLIGAMLLLSIVGLRQLYNMTRNDLLSRQRDLELRAVGVVR